MFCSRCWQKWIFSGKLLKGCGKPQNTSLYHGIIGKIKNLILMHILALRRKQRWKRNDFFLKSYKIGAPILVETLIPVRGVTACLGGKKKKGDGGSAMVWKKGSMALAVSLI